MTERPERGRPAKPPSMYEAGWVAARAGMPRPDALAMLCEEMNHPGSSASFLDGYDTYHDMQAKLHPPEVDREG
jgi:hypothetical protein